MRCVYKRDLVNQVELGVLAPGPPAGAKRLQHSTATCTEGASFPFMARRGAAGLCRRPSTIRAARACSIDARLGALPRCSRARGGARARGRRVEDGLRTSLAEWSGGHRRGVCTRCCRRLAGYASQRARWLPLIGGQSRSGAEPERKD